MFCPGHAFAGPMVSFFGPSFGHRCLWLDREMYWRLISQLRISICIGKDSYHVVCCVTVLISCFSGGADDVILKYDISTLREVGSSSIGERGWSSSVERYGDHDVSTHSLFMRLGMTSRSIG